MLNFEHLKAELELKRHKIKLQLHLGSMETEQQWETLMSEWGKNLSVSQLDQTAEEVGEAARELGLKVKAAYDNARTSVG